MSKVFNDILIYSKTMDEYITMLEKVFTLMHENELKIKEEFEDSLLCGEWSTYSKEAGSDYQTTYVLYCLEYI